MNAMIAQIIYEKWVANFLHPESWVDLRRTGTPVLTPNAGGTIPNAFLFTLLTKGCTTVTCRIRIRQCMHLNFGGINK
jgi:hypothetical protein